MVDLVLDWGLLGAYGTGLDGNGATTTVDTGGVNVGISFIAQDADAQAFTYDAEVHVGAGEPFDPNSHLKLFGDGGGTSGASATSTTVLEFSSADTGTYGDGVQNVSFRLSDIDRAAGSDLFDGDPAGEHQDIVTVLAYDAEGNEVPVSITPGAANSLSGQTLTGESASGFTDAAGSALVNIAGPVARIEIIYQNNGDAEQAALVSDIAFSTVGPEEQDPDAVDDAAATVVGTPVTIDVLANDTDPNGDPLNVVGTGTSPNGSVAINPDGTLEYTPDPGFTGTDSFDYTVSDDDGNLDTATVTVTVNPAPTPMRDGIVEGTPGADLIDEAYLGDPDTPPDRIDNGDAILPGEAPDDDIVRAGAGDDTVHAGEGSDDVEGGPGNDTLDGGAGIDFIDGGADRDVITVGSAAEGAGDTVQGGNAGDDYDVLDLTGVGASNFRLTNLRADDDGPGVTPNGLDGTVEFLDGTGAITGTMDFFNIEEVVPCFAPGTVIATPMGERLVEDLREGDRVITRDNGIQEIRWIGRKDLTGHMLARKPHMRPILIQAGSLGHGLPEHDLLVSPNHRVLVNNDKTALYFEEREVLAAAKHLTGLEGVDEVGTLGVSYIHFMFDRHEVVLSNGAWTESFQPGDYTLDGIGNAQRNEIFELFPELQTAEGVQSYQSARRSLKKHEARLIVK